jgi:hypothetical protein
MCRQTTFDTLSGRATKYYDGGRVKPGDAIPTIAALGPFHGYFRAMRSTASINCYVDHRGRTHRVKGTTGGQQGDGMEMTCFSLSQHPTIGRVFERHPDARGAGFADDLTIYAALLTALKVLAELRLRLGEDTNLRYNMGKLKIYIPGVTRDRARELVLKFINQDPSLESLRELYDKDIAEPDLNIINVTGMTCVGVPMGSPEFVTAFVRSKAKILQQDVQKLRIVPDPLIHYTLLRFCQHTRLAFLARNVPPAILMQPVDVNFDPASGVRTSPVAVPVFIQDLIARHFRHSNSCTTTC